MAESEGHAEYNPGNDIVCASVSCLMYTLYGAALELIGNADAKMDKGHSVVLFEGKEKAKILFYTIAIGMLQIQKSYPDHVRVNIS